MKRSSTGAHSPVNRRKKCFNVLSAAVTVFLTACSLCSPYASSYASGPPHTSGGENGGLPCITEPESGGLSDITEPESGGLSDITEPEGGGMSDITEPESGGLPDITEPEGGGVSDITESEGGGMSDITKPESGGLPDITEPEGGVPPDITEPGSGGDGGPDEQAPQGMTRYISSYIYSLDPLWSQDQDGDLTCTVWAGSELDPSSLPEDLEVSVKSVEDEFLLDFVDWKINWDIKDLEGQLLTPGSITIHGSWGEPWGDGLLDDGTEAMKVTALTKDENPGVYEPVLHINVVEEKAFQLPDLIRYYDESQPENVRIERAGRGLIRIQTSQNYPQGTMHKIYVRKQENPPEELPGESPGNQENDGTDGGDWTLIYWGAPDMMGGGQYPYAWMDSGRPQGFGIQLRNFKNSDWFQDGFVYEVVVDTSMPDDEGDAMMRSNILTVDMRQIVGAAPGDSSGSDDSSGGHRGGGSRDTQDSDTRKQISSSQLFALADANPAGTALVLDGVKVVFTADQMKDWAKADVRLDAEGKRTGDGAFQLTIKNNGKAVSSLESVVTIRIPLKKDSGLLRGISAREAERSLVAELSGVVVVSSFYDAASGEMVIRTDRPGTFQILKEKAKAFPDTKGTWAEDSVAFMTDRGVVSGYPDGTYRPERTVTGEEFSSILRKTVKGKTAAVPSGPVNRITAAKYINKVCGDSLREDEKPVIFNDIEGLSAQEKEDVIAVQRAGIMNGTGNGRFAPYEFLTRAEAAALAENLIRASGSL